MVQRGAVKASRRVSPGHGLHTTSEKTKVEPYTIVQAMAPISIKQRTRRSGEKMRRYRKKRDNFDARVMGGEAARAKRVNCEE